MPTRTTSPFRYVLCLGAALSGVAPTAADDSKDPIAREIARLSAFVAKTASTHAIWLDVKAGAEPTLARAGAALRDGHRLLALQRLGAVWENVDATAFLLEWPENERLDESAFRAEWLRMRDEKGDAFAAPRFDAVRPAAVRALAEAAIHAVPILHKTSLDYGLVTSPEIGRFYIGQSKAQAEFAAFCRALPSDARALSAPPLRDIGAEIDALESEVLAAYRPPASIARHGEFITVGSYVNEAREMNSSGLRYGALLKYMHAVMRFAPLRPAGDPPLTPAALAARLDEAGARFAADKTDQSLGALFVETGKADLAAAAAAPGTSPLLAAAIVTEVLPGYAKALEPTRPASARAKAELDVTLVRWPFT
jgi:hypothetical protein